MSIFVDGIDLQTEGLSDPDGNPIIVNASTRLDDGTRELLIKASEINKSLTALNVLKTRSETVLLLSSEAVDHLAFLLPNGKLDLIFVDDAVSYDPLSPMQLVQYRYDNGPWMTSAVGRETLESYTASKFQLWREHMLQGFGGCAKAFLPEIKRGYALTHVYDAAMFPFTNPAEEAEWTVEHNGKIVRLPRPIAELRVWNTTAKDYEPISPRMAGAPSDEEKHSYWQSFLEELRTALNPRYGDGFVDDCVLLDTEEVKKKYF